MAVYNIPLRQMPSFRTTFIIGDESFNMRLKTMESGIYMDLSVNKEVIFNGLKCAAGISLTAPYKYRGVKGDLMFLTNGDKDVNYKDFENGCALYYIL